ncbi:response regulator transcription factor [Bacillus sp. JJ1122]|uniref:response regulator transcription factor n=1 Tax=Bacillus sp. JJ1122 TaxID=3122951 RepID=UPI002FFEA5F2
MNVLIIDDHEIVRDGLSVLLEKSFCIDERICACDDYEGLKAAEQFPADLVLLEVSMLTRFDGPSTLDKLRKKLPEAKIVIYSMRDDIGYQKKLYEAGADGYLIKLHNRDEFVQSLDRILANQKVFDTFELKGDGGVEHFQKLDLPITKREQEVFILTVMGFSQKDIADRLSISVKTVENHRQKIGEKLETHKRYEWVELARKYKVFQN